MRFTTLDDLVSTSANPNIILFQVLPLENNMKNPQDFGGWNGVLNTGMVIVATLYTLVGFFGYLKYGDRAVLGSVTLLLPPDEA